MGILRRLFTLTVVAFVAGAVGLGIGLLVAPAPGDDTRARITAVVDEHGPAIERTLRKAGATLSAAVDYVRSTIAPSNDEP